ncbi:MAG: glycosyltransferase family 4 protein [Chloroflexi bacterium]|nr:glycosyltransferase family 4 protein [Chloroflexota bacterium]
MPSPQVVYSVNHRLGGGGMGNSVLEMLIGLHQAGLLKQAIVSSSKTDRLPRVFITDLGFLGRLQKRLAIYDPSGWYLNYLESVFFDQWASRVMQPCQVFSSWTGICATSLRIARQRGAQTILGLGSAHPRTVLNLVNREREQWGMSSQFATPHLRRIENEMALADQLVVQSRFSQATLLERGIPAEKITRLSLGVNVERFCPAADVPATPFRVLFLGQVMLRKGIQYLLKAWKRLGWRDAELWVVGKVMSDARPVLQRYADLPGLKLVGYVPDQLSVLQRAHVFIAPSVEDGFGLVVVEAMACGLPVVVSNHTGAADLIENGANGLVIEYDQVEHYARALETLRANPGLARRMGQAARALALQHTWDAYREQLVRLHLNASA